jgi:hypothetical protein
LINLAATGCFKFFFANGERHGVGSRPGIAR